MALHCASKRHSINAIWINIPNHVILLRDVTVLLLCLKLVTLSSSEFESLNLYVWPQLTRCSSSCYGQSLWFHPFPSHLLTRLQTSGLLSVTEVCWAHSHLGAFFFFFFFCNMSETTPWSFALAAPSSRNAGWLAPAHHSGLSTNVTTSGSLPWSSNLELAPSHSHPDKFSFQYVSQCD